MSLTRLVIHGYNLVYILAYTSGKFFCLPDCVLVSWLFSYLSITSLLWTVCPCLVSKALYARFCIFFCNYRKCVCFEKKAWCDTQYTEYKLGRNSKKKKKNSVQFLPSILYGQNEYPLGHPVYYSYFIHPSRLFGDYFE